MSEPQVLLQSVRLPGTYLRLAVSLLMQASVVIVALYVLGLPPIGWGLLPLYLGLAGWAEANRTVGWIVSTPSRVAFFNLLGLRLTVVPRADALETAVRLQVLRDAPGRVAWLRAILF